MEHGTTSVQAKIREFEARVRKWRHIRFGLSDAVNFLPGRRAASTDTRNRLDREESSSPIHRITPSTPPSGIRYKPQLNLPIGAATSPLPRKVMDRAAHLGITSSPLIVPPDDDSSPQSKERKQRQIELNELKKKANKLRLFGIGTVEVNDMALLTCRRRIGEGNYGSVDEYSIQGQIMAVKRIYLGGRDKENMKNILMEISFAMQDHSCLNIVHSYGFLYLEDSFYICMERLAICLSRVQIKTRNSPVPHDILQRIITDVVLGLKCLKDKFNILHRDVKPSNILLSHDGVAKICDFGIAGHLDNSLAHSENVGCPIYMAPERFDKRRSDMDVTLNACNYDVRSDVWSLGITQVELARGKHPYIGGSEFEMISGMLDSEPPFIQFNESNFSTEMAEFSHKVLAKDPRDRYKYNQLLSLVYIVNGMGICHEEVADWLSDIIKISDDSSSVSIDIQSTSNTSHIPLIDHIS